MNRRDFFKQAAATAAVGAVAPKTLAKPVSYTTPWMSMEGASRLAVGKKVYQIVLDVVDGELRGWKWIELKPRSLGISHLALAYQHRQIFLRALTKVISS
jgi:hypothetical protein